MQSDCYVFIQMRKCCVSHPSLIPHPLPHSLHIPPLMKKWKNIFKNFKHFSEKTDIPSPVHRALPSQSMLCWHVDLDSKAKIPQVWPTLQLLLITQSTKFGQNLVLSILSKDAHYLLILLWPFNFISHQNLSHSLACPCNMTMHMKCKSICWFNRYHTYKTVTMEMSSRSSKPFYLFGLAQWHTHAILMKIQTEVKEENHL